MSERKKALTGDLPASSSPLSRDSSTDTLNRVLSSGSADPASPGISAPAVRDGFFDYSDEKTLRSVCLALILASMRCLLAHREFVWETFGCVDPREALGAWAWLWLA